MDHELHEQMRVSKHLLGRHDQDNHARKDHDEDIGGGVAGLGTLGFLGGFPAQIKLGDVADDLGRKSRALDVADTTNDRRVRAIMDEMGNKGRVLDEILDSPAGGRNVRYMTDDLYGELTRANYNIQSLTDDLNNLDRRRTRLNRGRRLASRGSSAAPLAGAVAGALIGNELERRMFNRKAHEARKSD